MPDNRETKKLKEKATRKSGAKENKNSFSLVIVESPAKERTLSRFLGKGFVVKSSYGHLRDLPRKDFGLDVHNHFEPQYVVLTRVKKILTALKKISKECSKIYLATDYDREGEAIAWHLVEILKIPVDKIYRITFHEITQEAIQNAIRNPRKLDRGLIDAQVARRVLDRIVGYRLSPLLWEKVKRGLSAGRVQSVAVKFICEREEEIGKFKSQEYWTIQVELAKEGTSRPAPPQTESDRSSEKFLSQLVEWKSKKIDKLDIQDEKKAHEISEQLKTCSYKVNSVQPKEKKRSPSPPFMTSTLAQDASRKLGFSAKRTMSIAQSLYEGIEINHETAGLITYMRTDSLHVADGAREETREYIGKKYGKEYLPEKQRIYRTKSKGAQEAHEAIRPTSVLREPKGLKDNLNSDQFKLYNLIWKRFVASQMSDAVFDTVTVEIGAKSDRADAVLRANGSTLKKRGFLAVYSSQEETDEHQDQSKLSDRILPAMSKEDPLAFLQVIPEQHFTEHPPRYNEASLIKILEQNGIGRPSTYAPIVSTILSRGYVRFQDKKFFPTELGKVVNQQLSRHFPEIVDTNFTAKIEERLDEIAEGEIQWNSVVDKFYVPFERDLKLAQSQMQKIDMEPKDSGEKCELDKGKLLLRESRFGRYLCCENFPKCNYKISLDAEGKKILPQMTDEKCQKCGSPMMIKIGRRGRFLACTAYPKCRNIIGLDKDGNKIIRPEPKMTDQKCKKCDRPMLLRVGKRGPFLACSGFPKCRNIQKAS